MSHGGGFQTGGGTGRGGSMGARTGPIFQAPAQQVISTAGSGEKKSRKHKACLSCKAGHLKCDHGMPSCGRCVAKRIQCVYSETPSSPSPSSRPIVFVDHAFNDRTSGSASTTSTITTVHNDDFSPSSDASSSSLPFYHPAGGHSSQNHFRSSVRSPSANDYTLTHTYSGTSPLSATGFQTISLNPNEMQTSIPPESLASYFYAAHHSSGTTSAPHGSTGSGVASPHHHGFSPYPDASLDYPPSSGNYTSSGNYSPPTSRGSNVSLPNMNAFSVPRANFGAPAGGTSSTAPLLHGASLPHPNHASSNSHHPINHHWPSANHADPQWTAYSHPYHATELAASGPSSASLSLLPDGSLPHNAHSFSHSTFAGAGAYMPPSAATTANKTFSHKRSAANISNNPPGVTHLSSLSSLSVSSKLSAASTSSPPHSPKHRHRRNRGPSQSPNARSAGGGSAPSSATSSAGSLLTSSTITPAYSQPSSPHTPMHGLHSPADDSQHLGSSYSYSPYGENGSFLSGSSTHNSSPHSLGYIGHPMGANNEWDYPLDAPLQGTMGGNSGNLASSGSNAHHFAQQQAHGGRMLHPTQHQYPLHFSMAQHQQQMQAMQQQQSFHGEGTVGGAGGPGGGHSFRQHFPRLPVSPIQGRDSPMGDGNTGINASNPYGSASTGGSTNVFASSYGASQASSASSASALLGGGHGARLGSSATSTAPIMTDSPRETENQNSLSSSDFIHHHDSSSSASSSFMTMDGISRTDDDSHGHSTSSSIHTQSMDMGASTLSSHMDFGAMDSGDGIVAATSHDGSSSTSNLNISPTPASRRMFNGSASSPSNLIHVPPSTSTSGANASKKPIGNVSPSSGPSSASSTASIMGKRSGSGNSLGSSVAGSGTGNTMLGTSNNVPSNSNASIAARMLPSAPSPSPMMSNNMVGIQTSTSPAPSPMNTIGTNASGASSTFDKGVRPFSPAVNSARPTPFVRSKPGASTGSNAGTTALKGFSSAPSLSTPSYASSSTMTSPRQAVGEAEITNELLQLQDAFVSIFEPRAPINLDVTWCPSDSRPYWSILMAKEGSERDETVPSVLNEVKSKWESGIEAECASGVKHFLRLYEQCVVLMCGASSMSWAAMESQLAAHCEKMTLFLNPEAVNFESDELQEKECERFVDALALYATYLQDKQNIAASHNALMMAYTALTSHAHLVSQDAIDRLYVWTLFIVSSPQERVPWLTMLNQAGLSYGQSPMALTVTQQSTLVSRFTSGSRLDETALHNIWTQLDELDQLIQKIPRLPRSRPFRYMRIAAVYLLRIEIYIRLDKYPETLQWIRFLQEIAAMSPGLKVSLINTIKAIAAEQAPPDGDLRGLSCANHIIGLLDQQPHKTHL